MSKIFWGKLPDPHSKGREGGEEEERREHPQIKFYDYSTDADHNCRYDSPFLY
jgi:hypothetical protein